MPDTLEGSPIWILNFDQNGGLRDAAMETRLTEELGSENLTDLTLVRVLHALIEGRPVQRVEHWR